MFSVIRDVMTTVAVEVFSFIVIREEKGICMAKEWDKEVACKKIRVYKKSLQKNVAKESCVSGRAEYKFWKTLKELVNESKKKVDEEFSRKLSEEFRVNKQLIWKEVNKEE